MAERTGKYAVLHSCTFKPQVPSINKEIVKVVLQNIDPDDPEYGQTKLQYFKDPVIQFWLSKPEFRHKGNVNYHGYKKECECIDNLIPYTAEAWQAPEIVNKELGLNLPRWQRRVRNVCDSPWVYGLDVYPDTRIKKYFNDSAKRGIAQVNYGFLDLETSMLPETFGQIIIFSYVDWKKNLYIGVFRKFIKENKTDDEVRLHVVSRLKHLVDEGFKINIEFFDTEKEIIIDGFRVVHKSKASIIGIWNINFDIPKLESRMKFIGLDPNIVFNPPDTPKEYQYFKYLKDRADRDHLMDYWHTAVTGGTAMYIDNMLLFARIRKTAGRRNSYALGRVCDDFLNMSKLSFGKEKGHVEMQRDYFLDYIAYGGNDPSLMVFLEQKNKDILSLLGALGNSSIQNYVKSTVYLKDDLYSYYLENAHVIGSAGLDMNGPYDQMLSAKGGSVLSTKYLTGTGTKIIKEVPYLETRVSRGVADEDLKALYPSITDEFNISRATKLSTCAYIEGYGDKQLLPYIEDRKTYLDHEEKYGKRFTNRVETWVEINSNEIETCFGWQTDPESNAVMFCNRYFNLPDYQEMDNRLNKVFKYKNTA
ncbi:MAG: hypothetical protein GY804_09295 [Alphaproteobacteria bacterium]|nr:hypothetical protein [Alphaproteobacteria bacterium]